MKGYPFYDPEELNFLCCMYKLYERCGSYELHTGKEIAEDAITKPMAAVFVLQKARIFCRTNFYFHRRKEICINNLNLIYRLLLVLRVNIKNKNSK